MEYPRPSRDRPHGGAAPSAPRPAIRGYDARDPAPAQPREAPRRHDSDHKRMLDLRREGHFKYDLREILERSTLPPEQITAFTATLISKGARQSTADAKDFVNQKMTEGILAKPDRDAIAQLLDRYSRWR